jgi:hypothetical protein
MNGQRKTISQRLAQYIPVTLSANISHLSVNEKLALNKLYAASHPLNTLYRKQVWGGNEDTFNKLKDLSKKDISLKDHVSFYALNAGPWDRLNNDELFLDESFKCPNHPPEGAHFYPTDMTVSEFNSFVKTLDIEESKLAKGFYSVIKRTEAGDLTVIRYITIMHDL